MRSLIREIDVHLTDNCKSLTQKTGVLYHTLNASYESRGSFCSPGMPLWVVCNGEGWDTLDALS